MLERLAELQALDLEIDGIEHERGLVPDELITATKRRTDLETAIEKSAAEYDDLRKSVNMNELELSALGDQRRSARENALRASTPKEAAQFQNQELQIGTRLQELEEDTLPLMESLERASSHLDDLKAQLDELLPELTTLEEAEQTRVAAVDARAVALGQQRDSLASGVDAPLLRQYDQVRRSKRGVGLAEVVGGSCSGCNMRLPLHVVQKVHRGDAINRCPSCGRILWQKV